jgi:hypothetical protein
MYHRVGDRIAATSTARRDGKVDPIADHDPGDGRADTGSGIQNPAHPV